MVIYLTISHNLDSVPILKSLPGSPTSNFWHFAKKYEYTGNSIDEMTISRLIRLNNVSELHFLTLRVMSLYYNYNC